MNIRSSTQKLAILLALCILSAIYVLKIGSNYLYLLDGPNGQSISGVVIFYELYSGREFIIYNFILLLLIPFISNFKKCINSISGYDRLIILRIGRKEYYKRCVIHSIKDIWYFPIIINVCVLVMIHILYVPLFGNNVRSYGMYFFEQDYLNIFFITLCQIVGWSLLNILCFVFSQLCKNKYLYPFLLLICTIALTLTLAIIAGFFPIDYVLAIFTPFTLLTSGLMGLWYIPEGVIMIMIVILSILFYFIFIIVILKSLLKDGTLYVKRIY